MQCCSIDKLDKAKGGASKLLLLILVWVLPVQHKFDLHGMHDGMHDVDDMRKTKQAPDTLDKVSANSNRLIYHENNTVTFCRASKAATQHGEWLGMQTFNPVVNGHHIPTAAISGGLRSGTNKLNSGWTKAVQRVRACQATGKVWWELALTAGATPAPLMVIRSLEAGLCTLSTSSNTLHSCMLAQT